MTLDHIDTAVGFIVVILLLSLIVTMTVQLVDWTVNLRGMNLAWGLRRLVQQVPGLDAEASTAFVDGVLQHRALTALMGRKNTGVFLSLGAPFAHTMLRNLAALRPLVAGTIDQETKVAHATT